MGGESSSVGSHRPNKIETKPLAVPIVRNLKKPINPPVPANSLRILIASRRPQAGKAGSANCPGGPRRAASTHCPGGWGGVREA
jgi:hypothetical protein